MYESFFHFHRRPFDAAAGAERFVPLGSMEAARQTLARAIERGAGPGLLVGAAGLGKTQICTVLAEQFRPRLKIALLASGRLCSRRALLQAILFELGLPYRDLSEGELRLSLIDHVAPTHKGAAGMLLLVDEAHTLPLRLLEELRMITNLVRDGRPRVQLVLAGGPALEERFTHPKLESFNQRIAARCYLEPLTREETAEYVRRQIAGAGGDPHGIFPEDALRAVHLASGGIPRLINQVCDHALMLASLGGRASIGAAGIEEAWADLQQLPAPWGSAADAAPAAEESVVEFGTLEDDSNDDHRPDPPPHGGRDEDPAEADSGQPPADSPQGEPTPVAAGPDLCARLDEISEQLAAVDPPMAARVIKPKSLAGAPRGAEPQPEVELLFRSAHDPFAETFAEEELIVDSFTALVVQTSAALNRAATQTRRQFAAEAAAPPNLKAWTAPAEDAEPADERAANCRAREEEQETPSTAPRPDWSVIASDDEEECRDEEAVDVVQPPPSRIDVGAWTDAPDEAEEAEAADEDKATLDDDRVAKNPPQNLGRLGKASAPPKQAPGENEAADEEDATGDDRDLILLDGQAPLRGNRLGKAAGKQPRGQYRRLFTTLRRLQA